MERLDAFRLHDVDDERDRHHGCHAKRPRRERWNPQGHEQWFGGLLRFHSELGDLDEHVCVRDVGLVDGDLQ